MFNTNYISIAQLAIAFVLDIAIGDPQWSYHPVRIVGRAINLTENVMRKIPVPERIAGGFLTITIVAGTYVTAYVILQASKRLSSLCELIAGAIIIYFSISIKNMADEVKKVMTYLIENDLINARKSLSQIVGRDTINLDRGQIIRACVESVAESIMDGIISPMFYSFIGGPCAAIAYRAVNTLDSMVGHKDSKYIRFGWASARLDDIANYIPARISALLIPIAAFFCGCSLKHSLKIAFRDGRKHESPNSGIPEAAMAGALRVQLGGPSTYQGEVVEKQFIGDIQNELNLKSINLAIKIMYITSILFLSCGSPFVLFFYNL
jgi:adenosylcobinamide-phosphate synthase